MSDATATIEAVTQALETMAFVSAWPAEPGTPHDCPEDPLIASIEFDGVGAGALELAAPRAFARQLAANLLGIADPSAASESEASDALKELMNVACGTLLRARRAHEEVRFDMSIPSVHDLGSEVAWNSFLGQPGTSLLDADGTCIAVRLVEDEAG